MNFIRFGIYGLLVFAVLAHGGVEEWARTVFETGAGLLFLCWAVQLNFRRDPSLFTSPLLPPLAVLGLLGLAQWILGLSASPYDTRVELQLLLADILVLFLAVQAFRTLGEWKGFVWFFMTFAFVIAIFGILQHLTFNGKLYWFREMRFGGIPFGPYANRNHFAAFAELTAPLALVPLVLSKVRRERLFIVGVFAVVQIGALLLSASRGGILSLGCQLVALAFVLLLRREKGKPLVVAAAVMLVAVGLVYWLGVRQILERFSAMQSLEATDYKRVSIWRGSWHIFLDHPVLGTGLGTLQTVYPAYETLYDGKLVNHSHNDYLEALAETGLLGGFCCAFFLGTLFLESRRRLRSPSSSFAASLQLAGVVACLGFLVHSFVDFNLHIPANATIFFLMAYLATVELQPEPRPQATAARTSATLANY